MEEKRLRGLQQRVLGQKIERRQKVGHLPHSCGVIITAAIGIDARSLGMGCFVALFAYDCFKRQHYSLSSRD